ncbi:MAG: oxidoreductase [Eggerthellaceae bacterium]|nr:oxidoreductase [Eggerthellaceae bacterium]
MSSKYGLLVDYQWCTGCHSCEMACKVELGLGAGQYGVKLFEDGPRKLPNGTWEYTYLPVPTTLCNLCEDRVAMGKLPTCVHHCQAACMSFGTVEELAKKAEGMPLSSLFVPLQA